MPTKYASGDRDPLNEILSAGDRLNELKIVRELLSSLSYIVFILNDKRQIIYANDVLLNKLHVKDEIKIKGARPGEALACIHSAKEPGGCGTSEFCQYCAVVNVILDVYKNNTTSTKEARVRVKRDGQVEQLDLEITAAPLRFADADYVVFSAKDITDKKRKEVLERIFFHDIINLAGSLDGLLEIISELISGESEYYVKSAKRVSASLIEEIQTQQQLIKAESNELYVKSEAYEFDELIQLAINGIKHHEVAKGKGINYVAEFEDEGIITDRVLFNRIVINMIKNALEASDDQEEVDVHVAIVNEVFHIRVRNGAVMTPEVKAQVFQRSFSTKGVGRGLGTYSMKLLGENYLGGEVSFSSSVEGGTEFVFKIPQKISPL